MRTPRFIWVASVGLATMAAGHAHAQAAGGSSSHFTASARAEVDYDDNVVGGNAALAAARDLQPSDETYTLGANAAFLLPSSRQTFFLNGDVSTQRHQKNTNLDGTSVAVSGGLTERLGACQVNGQGTYSRQQTQTQDLAVAVTKNYTTTKTGTAGVSCSRRALFASITETMTGLSNDAKVAGFVNSTTQTTAVSAGYHNRNLGDISVSGTYSLIDYGTDPLSPVSTPNVEQYGGSLNYSRKIGNRLSGSASIGYNHVGGGGAASSSSDGLNSSVSFSYRLSSKTSFTFGYNLGNSASPLTNAAYVRSESLLAGVNFVLNQRITLYGNATRSKEEYRQTQLISPLQLKESDTNVFSGGMSVRLGRKISMDFTATHTDRSADVSEFNYSDNRLTATLTGRF